MRKLIFIFIAIFQGPAIALACDACQKQQPAFTRGITHGAGPTGELDWVIVSAMTLVALAVLVLSIRYLFRPGENKKTHIKHTILN